MKVLLLGARGAVGRVIMTVLQQSGHTVIPAGRAAPAGGVSLDLHSGRGWRELEAVAHQYDLVINASGVEDLRTAQAASGSALVELSASAAYLDRLARKAPDGMGVLLGAGLAPGLSTILIAALESKPGDDIDVGVLLGGGEKHGEASVNWTASLVGREVYLPPEGRAVQNLIERRRLLTAKGTRTFYRADFPDHLLIGQKRGLRVRSYLAADSRIATGALGVAGSRPYLSPIIKYAPRLGGDAWSVTAANRSSGETMVASGKGQSCTTGTMVSLAAERDLPPGLWTSADIITLDDVRTAIPEITIHSHQGPNQPPIYGPLG